MSTNKNETDEFLSKIFKNLDTTNNVLNSGKFFKEWFINSGKAYYFLFSESIEVTNIQFAEFKALLRRYIYSENETDKTPHDQLIFIPSKSAKNMLKQIVEEHTNNDLKDLIRSEGNLHQSYAHFFKKIIPIDLYYSSANVFIPPGLQLDLKSICAAAGYLHSCGTSIYFRDVEKTSAKDIRSNLETFANKLEKINNSNESDSSLISIAFFTKEDFFKRNTDLEKQDASSIQRNRDGVKNFCIRSNKIFVDGSPIYRVISHIVEDNSKLNCKLQFIPPGEFHETNKSNPNNDQFIWIVSESGIDQGPNLDYGARHKSSKRYVSIFSQEYLNGCPFQILDENKPAWVNQTTLPHALAKAMINLTLPNWNKNEKITISDPFVGTGTTALESLKFEKVKFVGSDLNPFAHKMFEDNLSIFTNDNYLDKAINILGEIMNGERKIPKSGKELVDKALSVHDAAYDDPDLSKIKDELIKTDFVQNNKVSDFSRLEFYLGLRAQKLHESTLNINNGDAKFDEVVSVEAEKLYQSLIYLKNWKAQTTKQKCEDFILSFQDIYSKSCSINPEFILNSKNQELNIEPGSSIPTVENFTNFIKGKETPSNVPETLRENSIDILITDPPYGFNTKDNDNDLREVFRSFLIYAIRALKNQGQMVICLPDHSYVGKSLSLFSNKNFVVKHTLLVADYLNKRSIIISHSSPESQINLRPPYYWESGSALRRSILHFMFENKK